MLDPRFALLAAFISVLGSVAYARDTFLGKTKPNRVTWALWALAPLIAFAAQLQSGVTYQAALSFSVGFGPALVLLASFHDRKAYWHITKFDWLCGALSVLALILWAVTKTGTIAIILSILADGLAATPTVIKSYHHPETESTNNFAAGIIAAAITLLTITNWTFANYAFAVYILLVCSTIYVLVRFPHFRIKKATI